MMVERSHFHQNAPPFLLLMLMFLQLITATLKLRSRKDRVRWRAWLEETKQSRSLSPPLLRPRKRYRCIAQVDGCEDDEEETSDDETTDDVTADESDGNAERLMIKFSF